MTPALDYFLFFFLHGRRGCRCRCRHVQNLLLAYQTYMYIFQVVNFYDKRGVCVCVQCVCSALCFLVWRSTLLKYAEP